MRLSVALNLREPLLESSTALELTLARHFPPIEYLYYYITTMLRTTAFRVSRIAMHPRMAARTMSSKPTIIYTETDEAPNLATYSLLPIVKKMVSLAGIDVVKSDISLSGRIISQFPERLTEEQRINDELTALGE